MRAFLVFLGFCVSALIGSASLRAEDAVNAPVYIVTYFEAGAPAISQTAGLTRQFAEASRKEPGNRSFEAFEEIGRPSRFAMLEAWRDKAAFQAHRASPSSAAFRDKLQPTLVGPFEAKEFGELSVAAPSARGGDQAVYVLTHVDVFPAHKDQAVELVKALAEAGRKDPGNLFFNAVQWDGHPNHFALAEGWSDRGAFEASLMAPHTKDFREKLTPLEGALYDERLYRIVP